MTHKRTRRILGRRLPHWCAVPVCLMLTSCGLLATEQVAAAPPAKAGVPVGGALTVGVTAPGGIDPIGAYEPVGKLISTTMCDTLVALDPETGHIREGLAESMVFSPDGTTVTFTMRRNLRFNDGTKPTPKDIDFSYHLLNAKSTASYMRGLIEPFSGGVSGALGGSDQPDESVLAEDVVGGVGSKPIAQALNEADFQMFVPPANGGVVRALAEPALAPISQAAYLRNPVKFAQNPVCVGPYKLAKPYRPGDSSIILVRNKHYYAENVGFTGGGGGYLGRIEFKIFRTAEQAYAAYGKGEVDLVAVPESKAAAAVRYGKALISGPETGVEFLGLPTRSQAFANADFRRALALAIDRAALAATLSKATTPATGFLPSALHIAPGENAIRTGAVQAKAGSKVSFAGCGAATPENGDERAARAALAKVREAPGMSQAIKKPIVLYINKDGRYAAMAKQVAKQWRAVLRLKVKVSTLDWTAYQRKAEEGPGFDGAFRLSWATDATAPVPVFNDPQSFLGPLFTSEGEANWGRWASTEFDFAFTADAANKTDVTERGIFFRRIERMLCDEMPLIPVAFTRPQYLIRVSEFSSARTSYLSPSTGLPLLREIYRG